MVLVKSIADSGAYVSLIEYNNIEGLVLLSELSRRRIRSISKLIRVGKVEVCMVMRVDKEKGYIDLSRRRVAAEDVVKCEERFSKGKAVNSIMRHLAETTGQKTISLNENIAWPLGRIIPEESGSARRPFKTTYEAFRVAITEPELVFGQPGINIDDSIKQALMKVIKRKLTPQPIKIRADIEITCFNESGIDAIMAAIMAGETVSTEEVPIKIRLIAPPLYVMMTTSLDKQKGLEVMNKSIEKLTENLEAAGGKVSIKEPPRVTSTQDETALKSLMEQMELDNQEIAGDTDEE